MANLPDIGVARKIQSPELVLINPGDTCVLIIITFLNGLLRRRVLKLDQISGLKEAAIDFCRRSLQKIEPDL